MKCTRINVALSYGRQCLAKHGISWPHNENERFCMIKINVDRYQLIGWLLCSEAGNQANFRLCELSVSYIIIITFMVVFLILCM